MADKIKALQAQLSDLEADPQAKVWQKIDTMNELAWELQERAPQRGLILSQTAYDLATRDPKHPYQRGLTYSLCNLGILHFRLSNYDPALSYALEALALAEATNDLQGQARSLFAVGSIYRQLGNYSDALGYQLKALEFYQAMNDREGEGHALNAIAVVYDEFGDNQEALATYRQALQIFQELEDKNGQSTVLGNMVEVYLTVNDYANALACGQQSLQLIQDTDYEVTKVYSLINLGQVYLEIADYAQAFNYFQQGLVLAEATGHNYGVVFSLEYMAQVYLAQQQAEATRLCLERALTLAREINSKFYLFRCHQLLAEIYEQQGDLEQALHHFKQFQAAKEKVFNEKAEQKIKSLQVRHDIETARTEAEIYRLKNVELEREIAERRQVEQVLQLGQERYQMATQSARVGVWDWNLQTNEFYLDPNIKMILGYTDDEIPNDINIWAGYVHPDDRQAVMEAAQAHLDGQTPEYVFEHRMLHKDGSVRWILVRGKAIRDEQGNAIRMVGTDTDITTRKEIEAALQEAHDKLEQRVKERTAELDETIELLRQEVAERERAEAEIRQRLVVEQKLAAISTRLMQSTDFDQAIAGTLAEMGEMINASRVVLFHFQNNKAVMENLHEWCAPGVEPFFQNIKDISLETDVWLVNKLRAEGGFYIEDFSQFPAGVQEKLSIFRQGVGGPRCVRPIYAGEEMIGFLGCYGLAKADPKFEQNLKAMEVIVGILGNAWQRERVLQTLEERLVARTRELSTFFDLAMLTGSQYDLPKMLEPVITRILEVGQCRVICVHLLDDDKTALHLVAQRNLPNGLNNRLQLIAVRGEFAGRLSRISDPIVTTTLGNSSILPSQLKLKGFQTYLGAQLRARGQPQGWLSCYRASARGFSLDETSLLVALAEQVGVIVENHRLRQRIEEMAVLEERQRLARDLHDSVTQSLYSLTLFTRASREAAEDGDTARLAGSLADLETTALQTLREMRLMLYELRPLALEQEGLARALELRFDTVERRTGITVDYQVNGPINLAQPVETELYHIVIEALNNTLKHAGVSRISVCLNAGNGRIELKIADDGRGFDPAQEHHGLGLHSMRERVERLGGSLEIISAPGAGTQILVICPLSLLRKRRRPGGLGGICVNLSG